MRVVYLEHFNAAPSAGYGMGTRVQTSGVPPAGQTAMFVTMPQWRADVNARIVVSAA